MIGHNKPHFQRNIWSEGINVIGSHGDIGSQLAFGMPFSGGPQQIRRNKQCEREAGNRYGTQSSIELVSFLNVFKKLVPALLSVFLYTGPAIVLLIAVTATNLWIGLPIGTFWLLIILGLFFGIGRR